MGSIPYLLLNGGRTGQSPLLLDLDLTEYAPAIWLVFLVGMLAVTCGKSDHFIHWAWVFQCQHPLVAH
jgi:hypothetical protein